MMKSRLLLAAALLLTLLSSATGLRAQGTAFTYQGELSDSGGPLNGSYDLTFTLYDALSGGAQVGAPNVLSAVSVSAGLFTGTLDFGSSAFTGPARWLQIAVHPHAGGATTTLSPRQLLTPTPYAIFAASAGSVASGSVVQSLNSLKDNVTLAAGANVTITPSGNTLTIASSGSGGSGIWSLNLTNTYYNGGNVGIGTASPGTLLDVVGAASLGSTFQQKIQSGVYTLALGANSSAAEVQSQGGIPLFLNHGGNNVVLADGGPGNLGIGTSMPNELLEVAATGRAFFGDGGGASRKGLLIDGKNDGTYTRLEAFNYGSFLGLPLVLNSVGHGNVGIDTISPTAKLDIRPIAFANNQSGGIQLACTDNHFPSGMFLRTDANGFPRLAFDINTAEGLMVQGDGSVGIGTSFAQTKLDIRPIAFSNNQEGGIQLACTDDHYRSGMYLRTDVNGFPWLGLDGPGYPNALSIIGSGYVGIGTSYPQSALDVHGETRTCVLTITGGCDVAEPFRVNAQNIVKGSVVVIDEEHPGQLKLSESPYDKKVAGIISGANGVHTGLTLNQQGFAEGGDNVALSGRVYALADASPGAIRPGDLLTTSDTPGHCMKVSDPAKAQGAIIGKAMSALPNGRGMVLVLVSLQ